VLDPIPYEAFAGLDSKEVAEMVHRMISEKLTK
jgi:hypothetical protein